MKLRQILSTDYFKLFVKRESRVVIGHRYASLWLLSAVLTATFLAIAFSNASLDYLSYKMEDPFINWVDIEVSKEGKFDGFAEALTVQSNKDAFHYTGYQTDKHLYHLFFDKKGDSRNLHCRYCGDIQTLLIKAILDDNNIVGRARVADSELGNNSYGVIITQDALYNKLGYTDYNTVPAYLNYMVHCDPEASAFFADIYDDHFAKVPIPVLAIVKRLPDNMDVIGTKFLYNQETARALNLCNSTYWSSLIYHLPTNINVDKFAGDLQSIADELGAPGQYYNIPNKELPGMIGHKGGVFVSLHCYYEEDVDFSINKQINDAILNEYSKMGVSRVFQYEEMQYFNDPDDYLSIHFDDLDRITEFQEFAEKEFDIDIDMAQINAKENFNAVSIMANILSWTMIVFAIICIILFIVNLLQSYFQKVKRNLGTFKAFGIGNFELISIYVLIMMAVILSAVVVSLVVSLLIQELLPLIGLQKEGGFDYLSLWSSKTVYAVLIIVATSVYTVYVVMKRLLKATPGDLIYDR